MGDIESTTAGQQTSDDHQNPGSLATGGMNSNSELTQTQVLPSSNGKVDSAEQMRKSILRGEGATINQQSSPYGFFRGTWRNLTDFLYSDQPTQASLALDQRLLEKRAATINIKASQAQDFSVFNQNMFNELKQEIQERIADANKNNLTTEELNNLKGLLEFFKKLPEELNRLEKELENKVNAENNAFRASATQATLLRQNAKRRRRSALIARVAAVLTFIVAIVNLALVYFVGPGKAVTLFFAALVSMLAMVAGFYTLKYGDKKSKSASEKEADAFANSRLKTIGGLRGITAEAIANERERLRKLAKAKAGDSSLLDDQLKKADDGYWYTDDDINTLLNAIFKEDNDVEVVAPLAPLKKDEKNYAELFKEQIEEAVKRVLPSGLPAHYTLLPINNAKETSTSSSASGTHWVLLVLKKDAAGKIKADYYDPLGKPIDTALAGMIKAKLPAGQSAIDEKITSTAPQQTGASSSQCGPMLVSNAQSAVREEKFKTAKDDWSSIRREQVEKFLGGSSSEAANQGSTVRVRNASGA